ncbi:MAG TPA: c-type cytochrome [Planctomycetota bacterium]|nr:c-type cytochrome [Planctomycetota bacterium]
MFRNDRILLAATALLALIVCVVVAWEDAAPGYERYQEEFRALVAERLGPERAAAVPTGLQQIWLEEAARVDRCTSCHMGVTWKGLEDAPEPFATHPAAPLAHHPIERFGCTLCHGGQGYATDLPDAHGWVEHWEEPLIDKKLAEDYRIRDPWAFLQYRCNLCHRFDREVAGADYLNRGKRLIQDKGCRACHVINGRGGAIGPDLTRVAEKGPEQYDYSRLTTLPTLFGWHLAHLQNPKSYSPDTVMPEFGFSTEDAQSIGLVLLSWRDTRLPASLLPGAILRDVPTPEEAERERVMRHGEGKFFVEKGCFICHDVSSFGIVSATKIGPDLALAVEDAPRRFGRTVDDFLMNPSGTMAVVLAKQIPLTTEERRHAIELLEAAYRKHKENQDGSAGK